MEEIQCYVCGATATEVFGGNGHLPLCGNLVCHQRMIDKINALIREAQDESIYLGEVY